ncbi:MAG: SDR family NAD(P)-dependent oxidoreductase [Rhodospirillaceae bacterium]|nr:MAG: SDR family NAD(P)-dependent oxidoreductase [Rhodospirillaceae bacterium]
MQGKTAIITGAFGALGRVVAESFVKKGARVALVDKAPSPPPELATALGAKALMLGNVDLSSRTDAAQVVEKVQKQFGGVDALVNIAGGFRWVQVADSTPEVWDLLYTLNVKTAANMCHAALSALIASGNGRIVNIGANGAIKAAAGMGPYTASKAGVHRLTEALAEELKGKVTVNAVLPSIIDTPQNRADMPDANPATWVSPAELAAVILFLSSNEASAVTGALVPVVGRV